MRKFLYIFFAILAYLALSSKSCGSDEKADAAKHKAESAQAKKNIKREFESEDLSKRSLRAFEVKAKQDLVDFSDYLGICYNQQLDTSFRAQARRMILDMFISDSTLVNSLLINEKNRENIPLKEFLNLKSSSGDQFVDFTFDSIEVIAPLRMIDDLNYKGKLSFSRYLKSCSASDTVFSGPLRMEADIFASKVYKPFGTDTLRVWSVFLGEIH
jgi:hypothetical protein